MNTGTKRPERLARLDGRQFDLLVVGGGIVGAGVARDAALRGLRVALVDKGDYGSGTSSKSSKLVHGGLRYLEHFEFGLVFESLRERRIQLALNPHLVWPLPFIFPVYKHQRVPLWKVNIGMWLYDILALFRVHKLHRRYSAKATVERVPGLVAEGLSGSVHYFDCGTDDARLTLANALSAESAGAAVMNYVRFDEVVTDPAGHVVAAKLVDQQSGRQLHCETAHVVFCGGPWTDSLGAAHGDGHLLRRTKGVHIVLPRERLPLAQVTAMGTADGRAAFGIPFHNCVYIGTTDTDYDGPSDQLAPTVEDIDYLLQAANTYFPDAALTYSDVRSTWSGLRPLIRDDAVAEASNTSREHVIATDKTKGITTVAGGKLTTYRAMAQEVVDSACQALDGRSDTTPSRCTTQSVPLDPALPPEPAEDDTFAHTLWRHHGSGAAWIAERMETHPQEAAPVVHGMEYVMAQVSYAVLAEHAQTVSDVLVRRLQVFYRAPDQGLGAADAVAQHMATLLGRDAAWRDESVVEYRAEVARSRQWRDGSSLDGNTDERKG